jgi:DNA modification methylase
MKGYIHNGDCIVWLRAKPSESVQLAFADPPFNIGYKYDQYQDKLPQAAYLEWCRLWFAETWRVLDGKGTFWLAISDENVAELCVLAKGLGFTLRNWCIWHYTFGVHLKSKFGRGKTHLLYFTKGKEWTWNGDDIRIESERQRSGDKRADPRGRVPSDVWDVSRLCGTFKERIGHPCQMPESILRRIVLACSNPGDSVIDPFSGSGTTVAVATREGRRGEGCELSPEYAALSQARIHAGHE